MGRRRRASRDQSTILPPWKGRLGTGLGPTSGTLVSASLVFAEMPSSAQEGWKRLGVEGVPWLLSVACELGTQVEQKNTPGYGLSGKPLSNHQGDTICLGDQGGKDTGGGRGLSTEGSLFECGGAPTAGKGGH